jgi:hypothetical protein
MWTDQRPNGGARQAEKFPLFWWCSCAQRRCISDWQIGKGVDQCNINLRSRWCNRWGGKLRLVLVLGFSGASRE